MARHLENLFTTEDAVERRTDGELWLRIVARHAQEDLLEA
jgi:hypothetical protein